MGGSNLVANQWENVVIFARFIVYVFVLHAVYYVFIFVLLAVSHVATYISIACCASCSYYICTSGSSSILHHFCAACYIAICYHVATYICSYCICVLMQIRRTTCFTCSISYTSCMLYSYLSSASDAATNYIRIMCSIAILHYCYSLFLYCMFHICTVCHIKMIYYSVVMSLYFLMC